jgi:N6-L-threonylcarbamoyladenine synthase
LNRIILAIETSCDETSVAILRGSREVLAHNVASQASLHARYGGVVPELASRNHLAILPDLVAKTLAEAELRLSAIDAFAATIGPGLPAALLVGASAAKGLALGADRPFLAVNHLEGHLLSPFFGENVIPAHVALIVSGGHTLLFDVEGYGRYRLLGRTLDDAAGEAFDKVAKLLGLSYPGGAEIDRLAQTGNVAKFTFPRGMLCSGDFNFSFSGLKTAVKYSLERGFARGDLPDICASFQEAVVDVLASKLKKAAKACGRTLLSLSGGVSANARLVEKVTEICKQFGFYLRTPSQELRTDNALMIAYAASHRIERASPIDSDVSPNFDRVRLLA